MSKNTDMELTEYDGTLNSCSGRFDVLGRVQVEQLLIDPDVPNAVNGASVVVAAHKIKKRYSFRSRHYGKKS